MTVRESDFLKVCGERFDVPDSIEHVEEIVRPQPMLENVDPRDPGFRRLARRVCLIRREHGSESTGFLVGPDLMLTAAHNLYGTAGVFADPAEVTILFDQFIWNRETMTMAFGDGCRLRHIPFRRQPDVVASSIRTDPYCEQIEDDTDLDYILVRLDRPIGLSFLPFSHRIRGWNDCSLAEVAPAGELFVVQHPLGGLQQFAKGLLLPDREEADGQPDPPHTFPYKTAALSGTSGSPILNKRRQVVGLHVGERRDSNGDPYQLGVSFQDIFQDMREQGVTLPSGELAAHFMDAVFGTSAVEKKRKQGNDWRGDRLFDKVTKHNREEPEHENMEEWPELAARS
jgi:hypothetical protein